MKPNSKTYADILTRKGLPIGITGIETKTKVDRSHDTQARPDAPMNISKSPGVIEQSTTRHNQTATPSNTQQVTQEQQPQQKHQGMML